MMRHLAESDKKGSHAKSVSKMLAILTTFDEMTPRQRTSDIAAKLHMNISTVSRHLNTMLDWGFLERDDETGFYHLGLEIVALAGAALQSSDIYRHAFPELQQISYKHDVQSHMGVPRGTRLVHMISICCESTMELLIPMGHSHPMYCSAMGRAILAYLPPLKMQEILKKSDLIQFTSETKVDIQEIKKELIQVRKSGCCIIRNELAEGKGSLAAPVFDRNREPIGAISVSASANRLSQPERVQELTKAVITAAGKISARLGYYPN